jgi:hypothetical protein
LDGEIRINRKGSGRLVALARCKRDNTGVWIFGLPCEKFKARRPSDVFEPNYLFHITGFGRPIDSEVDISVGLCLKGLAHKIVDNREEAKTNAK